MTSDQKSDYLKSIQENFASTQKERAQVVRTRKRWRAVWFLVAVLVGAAVADYAIRTASTLVQIQAEAGRIRKLLESNAEASQRAERPWLEIEPVKPVVLYDDEFTVSGFRYDIYLKNTGRSTASSITVAATGTLAAPELADDAVGIQKMQDELWLGKLTGSSAAKPATVAANRVPAVLAPGAVAAVPFTLRVTDSRGGRRNFLMGRIDYTDALRASHWTTFCFAVINRRGELAYCGGGNEEGSNSR